MLEACKPYEVFFYFEEISKIPHGSGNTKRISDYCKQFAIEHNLTYIQDESNNIILIKEATNGRESDPGVILQGHLDMVTVKEEHVEHDFENDGLKLAVDGDELYAKGTSLGGDDGIAVAYCLALLASNTISHPRLEVILTVDEEIGLLGANAIDLSSLKGTYLINLDSEEEGVLLTSCAGGLRGDCELPLLYEEQEGIGYEIHLTGMRGGHSGSEIDKERANAIVLAGRLLCALHQEVSFSIVSMTGGEKDNAIPREFSLFLSVEREDASLLEEVLKREEKIYQEEYAISDPEIKLIFRDFPKETRKVLTQNSATKVMFLLRNLPNGVQHMSMELSGLVETSLNLGILHMDEEKLSLTASVRSSVRSRKYELSDRLEMMTSFLGGSYHIFGDYPEWAYKRESRLRDILCEVYRDLFGKTPKIEAIHAGLECGILLEKCPHLDVISIGPNMKDIHTPQERLSISSTSRIWDYLIEILHRIH